MRTANPLREIIEAAMRREEHSDTEWPADDSLIAAIEAQQVPNTVAMPRLESPARH